MIPVYQEQFGIVPSDSSMTRLAEWASNYHPEILKMQGRKGQLEVEQRWNREMLKPEINLSYSLINAPFSYEGIKTPEWQNSYKLGVDFYFPIFLRKERGKLQKTTLNLESIDYDLVQLRQEIIASVKSNYAELVTNEELAQEYQSVAENYQRLLNAELFNLETGESDLFKLNIQQDKYIEAQVKYLNALVKLQKLKATLPYAAGLPFLSYRSLYE